MKVSIITVTYNCVDVLEESAASLFQQSYENIEYLIVDGGSTDGTVNLIKSFKDKVDYFISEPDRGIYDAINKGLRKAKGDIIGLLHADDYLASPNVIENIVSIFEQKNCQVIYGDLQYVCRTDVNNVKRNWKAGQFTSGMVKYGWMPPHPTLFLRKEVFETIGFYNLNYKISADYDYILRVFNNDELKISYISEVLIKMRMGGASNGSLNQIFVKSKEDYKIMRDHKLPVPLVSLAYKNLSKVKQFF